MTSIYSTLHTVSDVLESLGTLQTADIFNADLTVSQVSVESPG